MDILCLGLQEQLHLQRRFGGAEDQAFADAAVVRLIEDVDDFIIGDRIGHRAVRLGEHVAPGVGRAIVIDDADGGVRVVSQANDSGGAVVENTAEEVAAVDSRLHDERFPRVARHAFGRIGSKRQK